jgi:arylsulfatase A-like enzyme
MNIIAIVCDSLHLGFLGACGHARIEAPRLDRLASEGVAFDHHFPENLTTPPTGRAHHRPRNGLNGPVGRDTGAGGPSKSSCSGYATSPPSSS